MSILALPPELCYTTQAILERRSQLGLYYPDGNNEFRVSSRSKWIDPRWTFDCLTPGTKSSYCTIIWDVPLDDGANLCDPEYSVLLEELRIFVWSCFIDPRNSKALSPASLAPFSRGIRMLATWMIQNNYLQLHELDQRASERYLEAVHAKIAQDLDAHEFPEFEDAEIWDEETEGVSSSWVMHLLMPWSRLWSQSAALKDAGLRPIKTGIPFGGVSVSKISDEIATKLHRAIPPLPDELACEIMNAAQKYIDDSIYDLVRISEKLAPLRFYTYRGSSSSHVSYMSANLLRKFEFAPADNSCEKWRPDLSTSNEPLGEFKRLIDDFIGAASIAIQSETGMRISEILSLKAGMKSDGCPECVSIRTSRSGMLDLYYVTGRTSKMRANPEETEWLIGASPRGSSVLPLAVQAIAALHELLDPWRRLASDEDTSKLLFVHWSTSGFPRLEEEIVPMDSQKLSRRQKGFVSTAINWESLDSDPVLKRYRETRGMCIVSHQWRKNYARFLFQVNPKMIPAISRQFKHLSLAMTEEAYIGTDISLIKDVANENLNLTTDLLLKNARGHGPKHMGRMAKIIETYKAELEKIVEGMSDEGAFEAAKAWCSDRNLKIFFHGYGSCIPGLAPKEAECHKRAKTVHWANEKPNYAYRQTSVCTGCYLFIAGPDTIEYWRSRYTDNMIAWEKAKWSGVESQFHVAKIRAEQSANYLRAWGVEVQGFSIEDGIKG